MDAGFNLVGEIFDESGTEVLPLFTTVNEFQAPSTGSYTIQLHDQSFARRGQYTLTMLRLSPRIGAISGTVFHDLNGDRRQDAGEGGLAGWRVFIDKNNNGKRDSGEVSTTTDAIGTYSFPRLGAGTYVVRRYSLHRLLHHRTGGEALRDEADRRAGRDDRQLRRRVQGGAVGKRLQ